MTQEVIEFQITQDGDFWIASWNAPLGTGGITTQAESLPKLIEAIKEAVLCHFDEDEAPKRAKLNFIKKPEVSLLEAA